MRETHGNKSVVRELYIVGDGAGGKDDEREWRAKRVRAEHANQSGARILKFRVKKAFLETPEEQTSISVTLSAGISQQFMS